MGMALVAVSAGLAAAGYRGRPDTVGIDLGTTFSVIALRTGNTTDVLRDEANRALVPSAVYFAPGGEVLVGHAAQAHHVMSFTAWEEKVAKMEAEHAAQLAAVEKLHQLNLLNHF